MKGSITWTLLATILLILGNDSQGANETGKKTISNKSLTPASRKDWEVGLQTNVAGLQVTLSKPVLVGKSKGYLWFPTLVRLSSGDLMASMSIHADSHTFPLPSGIAWSSDGGLSWSPVENAFYVSGSLVLPNGDQLMMPYYLRPVGKEKKGAPYQLCPKGKHVLKVVEPGITVEGWPRPDKSMDPTLGLSGFVCNGQVIPLKNNKGYLATLYGFFCETNSTNRVVKETDRYSLVASESSDGVHWKIRSVIADEKCELSGRGACESAIARLKDGRILCVFRISKEYGHCFSNDDGLTWSKPAPLKGAFSVQPSLAVMPDGLVALSGGRGGLYLWLNPNGTADTWHKLDVGAHHNAHCPEALIKSSLHTSSYTEIVPLDDHNLLYIYDVKALGGATIPADSPESNSIWVIRVTFGK